MPVETAEERVVGRHRQPEESRDLVSDDREYSPGEADTEEDRIAGGVAGHGPGSAARGGETGGSTGDPGAERWWARTAPVAPNAERANLSFGARDTVQFSRP